MRLTWYSNHPKLPTGYGAQTAQVLRRMQADGHDIAIACNAGQVRYMDDWNGIPVYPGGLTTHSADVMGSINKDHDGQAIFTLYDVWVLPTDMDVPVASWVPIDHDPAPPEVVKFLQQPNVRALAMSRFGQRALAEAGVESYYIPHAIEPVFSPTPSDWRKANNIPDDAFLVTINAANRDTKDRKGFWQMFTALAEFQKAHADVWVYLHTWMFENMGGLPLPWWVRSCGLDSSRVINVLPFRYLMGQIDDAEMARLYSASDVLLATSKGEGFGIPVIEAMGCGTPAIVTDATAQPELVGDTGWRIPWDPEPDFAMGTTWARPRPDVILAALEEAYAERGTKRAKLRSREARLKALEYDADTVYDERWRPFLAAFEESLKPRPARPGNTKSAKRRAKR